MWIPASKNWHKVCSVPSHTCRCPLVNEERMKPGGWFFLLGIVIISVLLSINIIEREHSWYTIVAYPICRSVCLSVGQESILWHVTDWIRMPFGVVSGVGQGIGILDGVHLPWGEGEALGFFLFPLVWIAYFLKQKCILLVCDRLTIFPRGQYIVGNVCSLAFRRIRFEIKVGFARNMQKWNGHFTQKSCQAATCYAMLTRW